MKKLKWFVRAVTWYVLLTPVLFVVIAHWIIGLSIPASLILAGILSGGEALYVGEFFALLLDRAERFRRPSLDA